MFKRLIFPLSISVIMLIMVSCTDEPAGNDTDMVINSGSSHNFGKNCMSCHTSGKGIPVFTVAGSVYNEAQTGGYSNATVKLYTGPNATGTLLKAIQADSKGNFYLKTTVSLGTGVYATVSAKTGNTKIMTSSFATGNCISCHSSSTGKIWVN